MFASELRAFHAVAQSGSIRRAAELLDTAPSSVSRKVGLLEQQIGTTLLERTSNGVTLTHAGAMVAEYARSVILNYDSLRADLNDTRGARRKLIRVEAVESILSGGLIEAVASFQAKFETVSFRVTVMPAPQVIEDVLSGDCEVGLSFCSKTHSDITTLASIPEPIVLAVPIDFELTNATATLRDLAEMPLALPEASFGVRRIFDRAVEEAGLSAELVPTFTSNSFEALRAFVRCGGGAAVLPYGAVPKSVHGSLRTISIDHPMFKGATVDVIVLKKVRLSLAVSKFVDTLIRTLDVIPSEASLSASNRSRESRVSAAA
jgi:DNA-binding transcriptional LysR family regulator